MADFKSFFPTLLKHEGGFVNDPDDPGGATNKGITLATFNRCALSLLGVTPSIVTLRALTDDQAATIYKSLYWDAIRGDQIALQPLANIIFDFYVNAGAQAIRLLQRVLNDLGASPQLAIDGVMGGGTSTALGKADAYAVYVRYKQGRIDYYKALVDRRSSLQKFLKGWLARVASFPDLASPVSGSH